jgi:hypothetical protein
MSEDMFLALAKVGTSSQWSLLSSICDKLNKKLKKEGSAAGSVTERDCYEYLKDQSEETLRNYGVFVHPVSKSDVIININRAYGTQRQTEIKANGEASGKCTCEKLMQRDENYFGSHDYNGGRHACTASLHKGACPLWRPSHTSHLHSWRRGHCMK